MRKENRRNRVAWCGQNKQVLSVNADMSKVIFIDAPKVEVGLDNRLDLYV